MNRFGWVALLLHLHLPNSFYLHHIKKKKIKAKSNFQGEKIWNNNSSVANKKKNLCPDLRFLEKFWQISHSLALSVLNSPILHRLCWISFNSLFQIPGHRELGTNLCLYQLLLFPLSCFQNLETSVWDSLFQLYLVWWRCPDWQGVGMSSLKSLPTQIFYDFGKIFPLSPSFSHFPWFPCQVWTALRVKTFWRLTTKLKY